MDGRTETLLLAALIVFAGYTVFGVTGFGASPITVPVLAHVLPLPFVLSLAAALDLGSAAVLGVHTRKRADVRELLVLAPFTIIGLALGVTLLVRLPRNATLLALGVFVCGYALYIMLHGGPRRPLGRAWAAPAGLASGVLGALFGVGGPPYVVYIAGRIPDTTAQRATISLMVALNVGLRVAAFASSRRVGGRLDREPGAHSRGAGEGRAYRRRGAPLQRRVADRAGALTPGSYARREPLGRRRGPRADVRGLKAHEATVSTTRNRALPLIICSYASAAFASG